MAHRMAPVLVALNDLEGHLQVAGLFKYNLWNICTVFYQISTNSALARSLSDTATAGLIVSLRSEMIENTTPSFESKFAGCLLCGFGL